MPKICAGMQYFQMSAVPTSSAAAVRPHGPPHGTMFITPIVRVVMQSSTMGRTFIFL